MKINNNFKAANYQPRIQNIEYVIIHYTEIPFDDALHRLTSKAYGVSVHYLIKDDGEIFQLVKDEDVAWHAGESYWHGKVGLNQYSIGIELDNSGKSEFTPVQMASCMKLCRFLAKKYTISPLNFIGHSDVAPERKIDPGIFFNWELLAKNNFGIWHGLDHVLHDDSQVLIEHNSERDEVKNLQYRLSKLGYKIDITGIFDMQTNFVVRAFQSKFCPTSILKKGVDFYFSDESIFEWDDFSDSALNKLVDLL